jgi:adenine-specific DNA-methyltransferase
MDKLKMHSNNLTEELLDILAKKVPHCFVETKNIKKELRKSIDFDLLRQELSKNIIEGPQERYSLSWPGKREALLTANAPIAKTLRPCREGSVNFESTENLFIEGDNLDALKLMQETYLGKIKMIYIDPPYNTGNDFVYEDDFSESTEEFLKKSNQKDEAGNHLVANTESNGRFHSDWLSMMYPRLKLARNLLTDDGIIFISIDENEVHNLQRICEEIFGEKNVLGNFPVVMNLKGNQDAYGFAETHEYFIVCLRNKDQTELGRFNIDEEELMKEWLEDEWGLFKEADNLRATGVNAPRLKRPNLWYPIFLNHQTKEFYITENDLPLKEDNITIWPKNPAGEELSWYWSKNTFNNNKHNLILKNTSNGWQFYRKQRPQLGDLPTKKPKSFFYKPEYSTSTATIKLKELFGTKIFNGPKPVPFIYDLLMIGSNNDSIILDFFAGSATTAHAVMQLNAENGGNRKFIMVQLPESCDEKSEAFKAGYKNIAEIGKERIRRAGKKIKEENALTALNLDIGFRVLKVDSSNMQDVYYNPDDYSQDLLSKMADNIKPESTDEDLLFQVLLDWGVDLSLPVSKENIAGNEVFFVSDNALVACFAKNGEITEDFCHELAKREPLRVVFRDAGFKDDSMKINVEQIFKLKSPHTEIKTI